MIKILVTINVGITAAYAQHGAGRHMPIVLSVVDSSTTKLDSHTVLVDSLQPPSMTTAEINLITNPYEGLIVYDTTLKRLVCYAKRMFVLVPKEVAVGGSYTQFRNGWNRGIYTGSDTTTNHVVGDAFSSNSCCVSSQISVSGCGGAATVTGAGGIVYSLKEINGQCWMAENLCEVPSNYSSYSTTSWTTDIPLENGHWGYYNISNTLGSAGWSALEPININGHEGLLYQWSAAMNGATFERSRGACPEGFHVPSDCEWMYLEHGLGMRVSGQTASAWRGFVNSEAVGSKLTKERGYNNVSGFSALFGGCRNSSGMFMFRGENGLWWSSTLSSENNAFYRSISRDRGVRAVFRSTLPGSMALSVRCLKD